MQLTILSWMSWDEILQTCRNKSELAYDHTFTAIFECLIANFCPYVFSKNTGAYLSKCLTTIFSYYLAVIDNEVCLT